MEEEFPIDIHKKTNKTAVETIFTTLHAGGKFGGENSAYKISGGLHGVGSSVVNALSEYLNVTVFKNKNIYSIKFLNGGKKISPLFNEGKTNKTGTIIEFKPDKKIFSNQKFNGKIINDMLKQLAYLNSKITIKIWK